MVDQQLRDDIATIKQQSAFNKRILNLNELCAYTGYKKSYLYKLLMKSKVPGASKPGGKNYFFDKAKIDEWLLSNPTMTAEEKEIQASTYLSTHK